MWSEKRANRPQNRRRKGSCIRGHDMRYAKAYTRPKDGVVVRVCVKCKRWLNRDAYLRRVEQSPPLPTFRETLESHSKDVQDRRATPGVDL
jgi:hypothetical protein